MKTYFNKIQTLFEAQKLSLSQKPPASLNERQFA